MLQNSIIFQAIASISALLFFLWGIRLWRESQYKLNGKTILITGGSRGLGLVMARQLILQGARIALCARNRAELERAQAELAQQGEVLIIPCDVTDRIQVEQMVGTVRDRFGEIDVLINNAGTIQVGPLEVMAIEDFKESIDLHYWGPLYTMMAVIPHMRQRKSGRIVNISSIGGKVSVPHMLPYSASKFALVGLSEGMRSELAKDGIVVTTVCPGLIRTGSQANAIFKGKHQQEYNWFSTSQIIPLGSISVESAARRTIAAFKRGASEVVFGFSAQVADKFHALFPGLTSTILSSINRLLPKAEAGERLRGKDIHSSASPHGLTKSLDYEALRNNQLGSVAIEREQGTDNGQQ